MSGDLERRLIQRKVFRRDRVWEGAIWAWAWFSTTQGVSVPHVTVARGRSKALIPVDVDIGVSRAARNNGARIRQGHVARARPWEARERKVCQVELETVAGGTQEGVGKASQRLESAAERGRADLHVNGRQQVGGRRNPVNEIQFGDWS